MPCVPPGSCVLSRTAKNQKDFKVVALSGWRNDYDYAVLCAPYFQYPSTASQIYAQALTNNVCLLSWEHLIFLIENGVRETAALSFAPLWGFCEIHSHRVLCSDMKNRFMPQFNSDLIQLADLSGEAFLQRLRNQIGVIAARSVVEKDFWQNEIREIEQYSRETAIRELIKAKKIHQKIAQIDNYVRGLQI